MSSIQETLLFRINIERTGETAEALRKLRTELTAISKAGTLTNTGGLGQVFNTLNNTVKQLSGSVEKLASSIKAIDMTKVATSLEKTAVAAKEAGAAFNTVETSGKRVKASMDQVAVSADKVTAATNKMTQSQRGYEAASAATVSSAQRQVNANNQVATSMERVNAATGRTSLMYRTGVRESDSFSKALEHQRGGLRDTVYEMSNYIARGTGMFISTIGLTQAQNEAVGMAEALGEAQARVAEAQQHLSQLQESGTATTKELSRAQTELDKANRNLTVTQRNAGFAAADTFYFMSLLGVEIVGVAIPAFLRLADSMDKAKAAGKSTGSVFTSAFKGFFDMMIRGRPQVAALGAGLDALSTMVGTTLPKNMEKTSAATKAITAEMAALNAVSAGTLGGIRNVGITSTAAATGVGALGTAFQVLPSAARGFDQGVSRTIVPGLQRMNTETKTASTILPGLGAAFGSVVPGIDMFSGGLGRGTNASIGIRGAIQGALPLISRLGVIGAVVGGTLLLYSTNTFGARDAMNAFGKAVGDVFPALRPIGDALLGIASVMGITGEEADKSAEHFARAAKGWEENVKAFGEGIKAFEKQWNDAIQATVKAFGDFGKQIVDALHLDEVAKAFGDMFKALHQGIQSGIAAAVAAADNSGLIDWANQTGQAMADAIGKPIADALRNASPQSGPKDQFGGQEGTNLSKDRQKVMEQADKEIREAQAEKAKEPQFRVTGFSQDSKGMREPLAGATETRVEQFPYQIQEYLKGTQYEGQTNITPEIAKNIQNAIDRGAKNPNTPGALVLNAATNQRLKELAQTGAATTTSPFMGPATPAFNTAGPLRTMRNVVNQAKTAIGASGQARVANIAQAHATDTGFAARMQQFDEFKDLEATRPIDEQTQKQTGELSELEKAIAAVSQEYDYLIPVEQQTAGVLGHLNQRMDENKFTTEDLVDSNKAWAVALTDSKYKSNLVTQGVEAQKQKHLELQEAILTNTGAIAENDRQLTQHSYLQDLVTTGAQAQKMEFQALEESVYDNVGRLQTWEQELAKGHIQNVAFIGGMADQRKELYEMTLGLDTTRGRTAELRDEFAKGHIQAVAFSKGLEEGRLAIEQQKVALLENSGALTAQGEAMRSGELQAIAYTTGVQNQRQALIDTTVAAHQAIGTYMELDSQIKNQTITNASFLKGYAEQAVAIKQQVVALSEASGALKAYNEAIISGEAGAIAFAEGTMETVRAEAEQYVAVEKSRGSLQAYQALINDGIPQWTAYHQAINDTKMAQTALAEETAGLLGTYETMRSGLMDTNVMMAEYENAFMKAKVATAEWGYEIARMTPTMGGMLTGLDEVAHKFGTDLPNDIKMSEESAKNMIIAFGKGGQAALEMSDKMAEAGRGMLDGVVKAFREGGDQVNEEMDKLIESVGVDMPEKMMDSLESAALGESMGGYFTDAINLAQASVATGNTEGIGEYMRNVQKRFNDDFDKLTPEMKTKTEGIMTMINDLLSKPMPESEGGIKARLNQLMSLWGLFEDATKSASQTIEDFNETDLGIAIQEMNSYKDSVEELAKAAEDVKKKIYELGGVRDQVMQAAGSQPGIDYDLGDQAINKSGPSGKGAQGAKYSTEQGQGIRDPEMVKQIQGLQDTVTKGEGGGGGQGDELSKLQDINNMIEAVKTNMVAMTGIVAAEVGKINTIVPSIAVTFTDTFNTAFGNTQGLIVSLTEWIAAFVTAVNANVPSIAVTFTDTFNTAFGNTQGLIISLTEWIAAFVEAVNANIPTIAVTFTDTFNTGVQNAAGMLNMLTQYIATAFTTWTANINAIAVIFTSAFSTGVQNAAGMLNSLTQYIAAAFTTWAANINAIAVIFTSAFNTGTQNAAGSLNQLRSHSEGIFRQLESLPKEFAVTMTQEFNRAAQNAAGSLNSLKSNAVSNFSAMESAAKKVASAIESIGTSADTAKGKVASLKSAVESLPNIKRTITYEIKTVGSAPAGARRISAKGMLPTQFFAAGTNDDRVIVGEMNTEKVVRRGLRSGNIKSFVTNGMKTLSNLGMHEPEELTVIPQLGAMARRFSEKFGNFFAEGGTITRGLYGDSYNHRTSTHPSTGTGGTGTGGGSGGSTSGEVDGNGNSSQRVVTSDGRVIIENGKMTIDGEVVIENGRPTALSRNMQELNSNVTTLNDSVNANTAATNSSTSQQFTDERGNNFNNQSDVNHIGNTTSTMGLMNNNGGGGGGTTNINNDSNVNINNTVPTNNNNNTSTGNNSTNTQTGGGSQFNYQINGHRLRIQNGQIVENTLTAEEYAQADAAYFKLNGTHLPPYSGTGGTGTGGGGSTAGGDMRDRVTEAQKIMTDFLSNKIIKNNQIPTSELQDSTYGVIDNQRDPVWMGRNQFFTDNDGGNPNNPPGGGGGGLGNWFGWIHELINGILAGITNKLKIVLSNQWNGYEINRMVNDNLMNSFKNW